MCILILKVVIFGLLLGQPINDHLTTIWLHNRPTNKQLIIVFSYSGMHGVNLAKKVKKMRCLNTYLNWQTSSPIGKKRYQLIVRATKGTTINDLGMGPEEIEKAKGQFDFYCLAFIIFSFHTVFKCLVWEFILTEIIGRDKQ